MLFFDLEAYVPPEDRQSGRSSLMVNPTRPGHVLLGGCFFSKGFSDAIPEAPELQGLWLWNHPSEAELLRAIQARFDAAWRSQERIKILGKPTTDLVVCGAGIAKFDLPALFCRAHLHGIADASELYEVFLKCRPIDLANEASFLFPEETVLYPKTTREMAGRLGLHERKGSSRSIWELYEQRDYAAIEKRTAAELLTVLDIYKHLQQRIARRPR